MENKQINVAALGSILEIFIPNTLKGRSTKLHHLTKKIFGPKNFLAWKILDSTMFLVLDKADLSLVKIVSNRWDIAGTKVARTNVVMPIWQLS